MPTTVALIAHDRKKDELVNFIQQYSSVFKRYKLVATDATGQQLNAQTEISVERLLTGPMGGDVQIAAQVVEGNIAAVIFLVDPLTPDPQEPELQMLMRICNLHNVPIATNLATAVAVVTKLAKSLVAHLIFNPAAGQGNSTQDLLLIQQILSPQIQLEIHLTAPDVSLTQLVEEAIAVQPDLIIASGGDGTVSAVAGAMISTGIPLAILPRGTANAFAAALNIPANLRAACELILAGTTRVVDAAYCNGLPMVLLAGIGFEAEMVERASREMKNRLGTLAYILAGIQQLNEQVLFSVQVKIDDVDNEFQAGAVTVANAAPPTSVLAQGLGEVVEDDGLLDVTISTPSSMFQAVNSMISLFGAALIKSAPNRQDIVHLRTQRITITTDPPQKVVVDGEIIGTTPVEVECIPGGLTVFAPPLVEL